MHIIIDKGGEIVFVDLILYNGNIYSMDEKETKYDGIAMKNGRIVFLGSSKDVESLAGKETETIDLKGKTVVPGFIDAHQHMLNFGFTLTYVDCDKHSIEEVAKALKEASVNAKPGEWIIGMGFNETKFKENRLPTLEDFKDIPNPVYISRYCLHTAVVNAVALAKAGIDETTENPFGGEIIKEENENPTGVLREKAMDLVKDVMPTITKEQMKNAYALAGSHYVSEGITGVHEAGMGFYTQSFDEFHVLQEMAQQNELQVRMVAMILVDFFIQAKDMQLLTGVGNEKFKIGAIKMFADGTLNGRTAAVKTEYIDPPGTRGILMMNKGDLEQKVMDAHLEGYQISIHAIGDEAIDQVITAYEKALTVYPRPNHRHRIEHSSLTSPDLLERIKALHVIPIPQPGLIHIAGDIYRQVLLPDVLSNFYPIKTFLDEGIKLPGSSDCPVVPSSPFFGMYGAMTRETKNQDVINPEQRISLYEAVKMYTSHSAYAGFTEDYQGTLEVGKLADAVVLPEGFMDFSAQTVKETAVEYTIIGGEIVYQKTNSHK